jgi:hypothetical protein
MEFWAIVLGVVAFVILLGYRHDRRRRGQLADVNRRAGAVRRYVNPSVLYQELGAGQNAAHHSDDTGKRARDTDAPR